ncbi:MAG: hypothetical protein WDO17_01635 [Alphaproteobacteria bacterium]
MRGRRKAVFSRSLFAAIALSLILAAPARPQDRQSTLAAREAKAQELRITLYHYYEKPTDTGRLLMDLDETGWGRLEFVLGFLAGVFAKYPEAIEVAKGTKLGRETQSAVFHSLRLADRYSDAIAAARQWGWPLDQMTRVEMVTPLHQLKVEHRSTLDGLLGASLATGDEAYVRQIYDYYDGVVSAGDIDVRDIVATALLKPRSDKDAIEALKRKYSTEALKRLNLASWALVMLEGQAREHKFVAAALDRYAKEKLGSPTNEGFAQLRSAIAAKGR